PVWSPDDSLIAYQSDLDGTLNLYVYEVATGITRQVTATQTASYAPTWYCDAPVLIFTSDETGDANLFELNALPMDGEPVTDLVSNAVQLTDDPANDQYPENTPSEENASREGQLPPARQR